MPDPNQGLWRHERTSPLDPRGPNDFHLSYTDLGQGFYGWPNTEPVAVAHANKLFDHAYSMATGGWNPNVKEPFFTQWGNLYGPMFGAMSPSNPLMGYDYTRPLQSYFGQEFTETGTVPDSSVSFADYAYNQALPDIWKSLGFEDTYNEAYGDQLADARDQARRDMRFNYLRRGMSGDNVDDYIRDQVNRIYNANTLAPTEGIDDWLSAEAASAYDQYKTTYDANPLPTLSSYPSGTYEQQRANPSVQAMRAAPLEPTTALANQQYEQGPGAPDLSGLNLGDLFASIINKYPPSAQRRQLTNPPAVPQDVLDAEISTYFNLETTPQQTAHKGKVVK